MRSYAYIRSLGAEGLKDASETAVLNANYLLARLKGVLPVPQGDRCMHEFVASAADLKRATGVRAMDIAKALLDRGFHAPTVYFPLIVEEALMVEPTETESPETVEALAEAFNEIARSAATEPDRIQHSPHHTPVSRPDDALAARHPVLTWNDE